MSDIVKQTRNTLVTQTAIFGGATVGMVISGIALVGKIFTKGLFAALGSLSFFTLLAFILFSLPTFMGAFKAYSDTDYAKSQSKGWIGSLSAVALVILDYMI
ncbi:MAG: hypothetical protein OHK0053_24120 [Microscillaceae bacterium]